MAGGRAFTICDEGDEIALQVGAHLGHLERPGQPGSSSRCQLKSSLVQGLIVGEPWQLVEKDEQGVVLVRRAQKSTTNVYTQASAHDLQK